MRGTSGAYARNADLSNDTYGTLVASLCWHPRGIIAVSLRVACFIAIAVASASGMWHAAGRSDRVTADGQAEPAS